MSTQRAVLVATTNNGKLREIQSVLGDLPIDIKSLGDIGPIPKPIEDAATFAGNAATKALCYHNQCGLWTLSDDSGLEVDELNGAPGVNSARYAGEDSDDVANNRMLIDALRGIPQERRTARFRCSIALAFDGKIQAAAEGTVEGIIIDDPRGTNGFGYDPHFWIPELGRTMAQLIEREKNEISHRGRALAMLRPKLARLFEKS